MSSRTNHRRSGKGRRKGPSRSGGSANDRLLVASTKATGSTNTFFPKEDFARRMGSWILTQTPPRVIANQIYWVKAQNQATTTVSTTVPTEFTQAFTLSQFTNSAGLSGFFDQYCIYSALVEVNFNYTGTTPGGFGTMYTAIDYDNVANLASATAYQAYESVLTTKPTVGESVQRLIHPAVAPALYSGSAFNNFGISRMWVDCANTSTPHYGFRSYFVSNVGTVLTATFDMTCIIGFRNNI